ncbi:MAG: type III pantothenate kinase [Candidatus Omnitrophica bacterium]|nr:type III pantothenate kinase [Candidatus Omnitrophota bacterium]
MLILLDIGNTSVTIGTCKTRRLAKIRFLHLNLFPKFIQNCLKSGELKSNCTLVVSSVVPKITDFLKKEFKKAKLGNLWIAGDNLQVPILHNYRNVKELGIDRAVNVSGALKMFRPPLLIIDIGTAITADYVSKSSLFEGGLIVPGPGISFEALVQRAALIPKTIRMPHRAGPLVGRSTRDCLASGIVHGYGAMIDGIVERFKAKFGKKIKVIITGGYSALVRPVISKSYTIDPLHSIRSLLLIYHDQIQRV